MAFPTRDADRYRVAVALVTALRWLIVSPTFEAGPTPPGKRPHISLGDRRGLQLGIDIVYII